MPAKRGHAKAKRFDKDASTPKKQRQWKHVYESAKKRGADKASAIRQASGTVK